MFESCKNIKKIGNGIQMLEKSNRKVLNSFASFDDDEFAGFFLQINGSKNVTGHACWRRHHRPN